MSVPLPTSVGERIRRRRLELGLTQSELGGHWCSKGYVSLVERGRLAPSRPALDYFATQLGREPGWFLADPLSHRERVRRLLACARVSLRRNRLERARGLLRTAATHAMDADDEHELAVALECAGHLHMALQQLPDALRSYRLAASMFRTLGFMDDAITCTCSLVLALLVAQSVETARAELMVAEDTLRLQCVRSPLAAGAVEQVGGMVALAARDLGLARQRLSAAAAIFRAVNGAAQGTALLYLGLMDMGQRHWQSGGEHLASASRLLADARERSLAAAAAQWLTEARARQRRWDEALLAARQAIHLLEATGDRPKACCAMIRLAEIHLAAGDASAAHDAAWVARERLGRLGQRRIAVTSLADCDWRGICGVRLAYVEAAIARRTGNPALAEQQLRVVATQLTAWPQALLYRVRALHERAACLSQMNRVEQAEACYAEALSALEAGWPAHDPALPDLNAVCCMPSPLWFRR